MKTYYKVPVIFTALPLFVLFVGDYLGFYGLAEFLKDYSWIILPFYALLIFLQVKFLKWVAKIASKNNRSVNGFIWLAAFFPFIVAIILLIVDKNDQSKSS
jgi:hypothetical protein